MKFIKIKTDSKPEAIVSMLKDNETVNKNVKFDDKRGKPHIHVKDNNGKIKLTCEYLGGATKDNAFLSGTSFFGSIREKNGYTEIKGVITTAPIFHLCLFLMFAAFIVVCIVKEAFNVVPICLLIFDIFMYKDEFKKQGIIERYVKRAVRKLSESTKK